MKNKILFLSLITIVSVTLSGCIPSQNVNQAQKNNDTVKTSEQTGETKTVDIIAKNFSFSPTEIKVKKGEKIKINLINQQGFHDLVIDEFGVSTKQIGDKQTDSIEFTADKIGEFEYYCSVGQHRQMGMVGKLIVE